MKSSRIITALLFLLTMITIDTTCYSQDVPEEARKHYARGQAAIEMIESEADNAGVIREFETAIQLAPAWADPYYDLGMFQDKIGKYDEAIIHLKKYLELAPQAANASQVQNLIYKIGFKQDKADEKQMMIDLLVNGKRTTSGDLYQKGVCVPSKYFISNDKLFAQTTCWEWPEFEETVPVKFDGVKLEFKYSRYFCPGCTSLDIYPCERKIDVVGTVIEKNPLRFAIIETVTNVEHNTTSTYEGTWTFSK